MYQFTVWLRNDVQMFKLRHKSGTPWLWTGYSLIFLTVAQTNVSVKDAAETWDYVASTVVIVWVCSDCVRVKEGGGKVCSDCVRVTAGGGKVCSDCVRVTTGVWKVPGEKPVTLPTFYVITLSYCSTVCVFELFASSVLPLFVFVFCLIVTAYRVL